jgi:hypothetical protein
MDRDGLGLAVWTRDFVGAQLDALPIPAYRRAAAGGQPLDPV